MYFSWYTPLRSSELRYSVIVFCGYRFYRWSNGDTYDGDYKNDLKDGHGVFRWSTLDTYEGEVRNGVRHGKGVYRYADGRFYAGMFVVCDR